MIIFKVNEFIRTAHLITDRELLIGTKYEEVQQFEYAQKKGKALENLLECKNWKSQRVGKNAFVLFKEKIENRYGRCKLGFLVCTTNFAETIEREMLRSSKTDLLVVPINGDDLRQLVESKNRSQLLRSFVDRTLLI